MHIGLIFAMQEECDAVLNLYANHHEKTIGSLRAFEISHNHHRLTMILGGIGKVNAARATTLLLHHGDIDILINTGVAGGIDTPQETLVFSKYVTHHDVDVCGFGRYVKGQVPQMPPRFHGDPGLLTRAEESAKQLKLPYRSGTIASGDQFVTTIEPLKDVLALYDDIHAVEMEAAGVAQVCYLEQVPFLIIRSISDVVGSKSQNEDFEAFVHRASARAAALLHTLVDSL